MNKFEKIYNEYIEKPVLKFDGNVIDLYVDREDMLHLLEYGKDLEQVLYKIKEYCNNRLQYYNEMRRDYMREFDGYAEDDNEHILELLEEIE